MLDVRIYLPDCNEFIDIHEMENIDCLCEGCVDGVQYTISEYVFSDEDSSEDGFDEIDGGELDTTYYVSDVSVNKVVRDVLEFIGRYSATERIILY